MPAAKPEAPPEPEAKSPVQLELELSRMLHRADRSPANYARYCAAREAAVLVGLYDPALEH